MSLYKHRMRRKDGSLWVSENWYYRFEYKGKPYNGSTGTTNKTIAKQIEAKEYNQVLKKVELGENPSITLETGFNNFLDSVQQSGELRNITRYLKKLLGAKKQLVDGVREEMTIFGFDKDKDLDKLSTADVQKLILARRKELNSDQTILHEICYLNQAINLNRKLGHPVPSIDFSELKKDNKLKPSKGRLRYLSKKEEEALLAELDPANYKGTAIVSAMTDDEIRAARQDVYDLVILLLGTGARYSEIAKLEIASVNLVDRTIALYRPKVKNESPIQMTPRVYDVLNRRITAARDDQKFVFENKAGDARNYAPGAFKSACKRAKIKGITIHSLRHTTASWLIQNGATLSEVQQVLGHASFTTTQRYAHLVPQDALNKAARILAALDAGK